MESLQRVRELQQCIHEQCRLEYTRAMRLGHGASVLMLIIAIAATLAVNAAEGQVITDGPTSCSAVALTYDLCPVKDQTGLDAELIEFLKNREVPATFLCPAGGLPDMTPP